CVRVCTRVFIALSSWLPAAPPGGSTGTCAPWCPLNSECVSATACRCKPGFASSSTEIFTDPLEICDDINECVPPMKVSCGKLADCQNVEGSYYCMCSPGYELRSGGTNFTNASENTCQDVDECKQNPRICKGRSTCINTQGSYTCQCLPGFELNPEDPKLCTDVNECASGQNPCHKSAHCLNQVGGYQCRCRPGWKPVPGSPNGPNSTVCEDVDECSFGQQQCHQSTICTNTLGSYQCHCRPGWELIPGSVNGRNSTICKGSQPSLTPETPPPHTRSLSRFFEKVNNLHRDFKPVVATNTIQNLIGAMDELLKAPGDVEDIALPVRHQVATQLLLGLEQSLRTLAESLPEGPFTYRSPSDTELSLMNQKPGNGNVTLGQKELQKAHEGPLRGVRIQILSPVNSVFLTNNDTEKLASPVTFAFSHDVTTIPVICAFWKIDSNKSGHWDTTGCWKLGSGDNSTTCQCNHLSSFAILMAHYDIQDWKLELITKVGLSLSLVCLLLCILTFLLVRPIQSSRTTVHLHLCVCLFVGSAIFLAGPRCRLVAGLLHYCFLAAFCWMSLEGLVLYFLVVRVFQGQGLSTRWLCRIGYGVPRLIVAISAPTAICWMGKKHGFFWSFVGPLALIILVSCNAVIFVITVWRLTQKECRMEVSICPSLPCRVLTVTAIAQLFVLGCTWVFGLFLFEPYSSVLTYIFTILNCLQGLFLYVLLSVGTETGPRLQPPALAHTASSEDRLQTPVPFTLSSLPQNRRGQDAGFSLPIKPRLKSEAEKLAAAAGRSRYRGLAAHLQGQRGLPVVKVGCCVMSFYLCKSLSVDT
uniref:Adhesion G protein-coupled receptor E5 n=1 Tax=Spermophilus dauricus TaxID=99837 RepID=A0A8C9PEQ8_SPEDA